MEHFRVASRTNSPLTPDAWRRLQPLLIQEMPDAKQRFSEFQRENSRPRSTDEAKLSKTEARDAEMERWESSQKDIRAKLRTCAASVLYLERKRGDNLKGEDAADFASATLHGIRESWEHHRKVYGVVGEWRERGGSDMPVPSGDLTLDAMKWVYNEEIKSFAERSGKKDLFICDACVDGRFFTLEGCIQHYSSRHTHTMGSGKSGVSWTTALWEMEPPFALVPSTKLREIRNSQMHAPTSLPTRGGRPPTSRPAPFDAGMGNPYPIHMPGGWQVGHYPQATPPPLAPSYAEPGPYDQMTWYAPIGPSPVATPSTVYGGYSRPTTAAPGPAQTWVPPVPIPPPQSFSPPVGPDGRFQPPHFPGTPAYQPLGTANPMPYQWPAATSPVQPMQPGLWEIQFNELARVAHDVYLSLSTVPFKVFPKVPPSVSIFCAIQRSAARFTVVYKNELNFELFYDCVVRHDRMKHIREAQQVTCKTCHGQGGAMPIFTFQELMEHFKRDHIDTARQAGRNILDWKTEMLALPHDILPSEDWLSEIMIDPDVNVDNRDILRDVFRKLLDELEGPRREHYDPRHPDAAGATISRSRFRDTGGQQVSV